MSRERIPKSPQSGRNTPNEGFFNSKNYTELDYIQRRERMLADASVAREEKLADEEQHRLEGERKRKAAGALERSKKESQRGPCDMCNKAANRATQRTESTKVCTKILRRPIAPRCTCMDPTDGELPVLAIEYPVDIDDWAYKPFSTIVSGGAVGYRGLFPLLMQKCTEAEEKDSLQVQTETRRHSVVTTNYLTGRIKLETTGHKDVHMSVFPVLHVVLSSDDEDESSSSDAGDDDEQDVLTDLGSHAAETEQSTSEHDIPTPRRRSPVVPTPGQQRRRSSIAPGSLPGRRPQGMGTPRVVRRRSIDQSTLALSFANALEAAMTPISEEIQEKRAVSPGEEFDVKHAEETMIHMAQNLQTLETFLRGVSTSSVSDMSSSDDSL